MKVVRTVADVRAARAAFPALGLVPTMGFLHQGHVSLIEQAKRDCGAVAVSIFVNPTQFAANEDLSRYPRDLDRDLAMLDDAAVDLAFVPEVDQIYPSGFTTSIDVGPVATVLEGASRPGHFAGVATVVGCSCRVPSARCRRSTTAARRWLTCVRPALVDLRSARRQRSAPTSCRQC